MCFKETNIFLKMEFPSFSSIQASTHTYIISSNFEISIEKLFEYISIVPYEISIKKGKRFFNESKMKEEIPYGSVVSIKYENRIKGVNFKVNKNETSKWFRNSITIVMYLDKLINFKLSKNGTFQVTGCKHKYQCEDVIKYTWCQISKFPDIYNYTDKNFLSCFIIPCMRNIDFSLNFIVDRDKLNMFMNKKISQNCILETSFGYTGVNIKIPINNDITKMKINKVNYINNKWNIEDGIYEEYLNTLSEKDRIRKLKKPKYNTFLVFHSGKVIMSGRNYEYMEDVYYMFTDIIKNSYKLIEEQLDL